MEDYVVHRDGHRYLYRGLIPCFFEAYLSRTPKVFVADTETYQEIAHVEYLLACDERVDRWDYKEYLRAARKFRFIKKNNRRLEHRGFLFLFPEWHNVIDDIQFVDFKTLYLDAWIESRGRRIKKQISSYKFPRRHGWV